MKMKKRQKVSVKNVVFVMCTVFILSLVISSLATAAQWPTVADPKGIKTDYPQQLELDKFEKQTGKKLKFQENPLFAEKVKKGELPAVEKRLPEEPLVVMPYDEIGRYGGKLRGICIAPESGTSEVLAWRHANIVRFSDDTRTIVPNVAKSWKWNDDYTEITFTLRKGHRWSDGAPFTTDDVVFYMNDIILNKELHKATPSPWGSVGASVEKIDAVTVKFKFKKPFTGLLYYLGGGGLISIFGRPSIFSRSTISSTTPKPTRKPKRTATTTGYSSLVSTGTNGRTLLSPALTG